MFFLHSHHTNGIEEMILNVGSSMSVLVSLPSTTFPILATTEMSVFLPEGGFWVVFYFLFEGKYYGTTPSSRFLHPTPKTTLVSFALK